MFNFILLLLCLFSGSVFAAAAVGRRAEETLPVTAAAIIVILYCFYCLDMLAAGCYFYVLWKFYHQKFDRDQLKQADNEWTLDTQKQLT